jgi:[lysine-biosynthesis-protein LysW]--L-2-aminoadipate ligase
MKFMMLHSRIRAEEKLLVEAFGFHGVSLEVSDLRSRNFHLTSMARECDVLLERCISHNQAINVLRILENLGVTCVNTFNTALICGDKLLTSLALVQHNVPTPETAVAFTSDQAIRAIEEIGYPVVIKPVTGSWGRLLARINDRDAAEAVLEHKEMLGSYHHKTFYIQKYIEKPERDLRTFVAGDKVIAGIYRTSEHWITNTARGGKTSNLPLTNEIQEVSLAAARACGGGLLAVDLIESAEQGLLVNEVNYTLEFRNSIEPTGVNIHHEMAAYVIAQAEGRAV